MALESPSGRGGLLPMDLLVLVQGQNVLDRSHEEVVQMIKGSGLELRLTVERGENLIPNMALLGKSKEQVVEEKQNVYLKAATEEIEESTHYRKKEKVFTTAGPPKIETDQYMAPMGLYSAETVARMADTVEIDPKLTGTGESQDRHFSPEKSLVLDMILQDDEKEMRELGMSGVPTCTSSASNSRTASRADSLGFGSRRGSLLPNPQPLPGMEPPQPRSHHSSLATRDHFYSHLAGEDPLLSLAPRPPCWRSHNKSNLLLLSAAQPLGRLPGTSSR